MSTPLPHEIAAPDGPLPALLWLPEGAGEGAPAPGLVVFQEIFGVGPYLQDWCARLASLGYAVLAPHVYARQVDDGAQVPVVTRPAAEGGLEEGLALVQQVDWDLAVRDGLAARDALAAVPGVDPARVGLLGFCFGGGLAFHVAAAAAQAGRPVAALVSFYGSALPNLLGLAEHVDVPSLHVFGDADAYIPMDTVEEIREAVTAGGARPHVRFELHEGAGHAFDNPDPMFHHAPASAAARAQAEQFLTEVLPVR
ncbi:dienelactone hydrolase family protein [Ornithinimicrobium tianjinense]|uniref:Dienelactone hydrolase n=1 Tax=Ornithinimicrobium tianjinense TaxID=1195761 RepID=A0A917F7Z3_9MICO|nr:dienelactone hydrolase family protein [Ornithinimicrobium tianjinense]GGF58885.1 dienelactone hydrolase [Ornithinimicrobium tianjinense]